MKHYLATDAVLSNAEASVRMEYRFFDEETTLRR
jgi:hypothetical protein